MDPAQRKLRGVAFFGAQLGRGLRPAEDRRAGPVETLVAQHP